MRLISCVREAEFAALDFETTGAAGAGEEQPLQVGIVLIRGWQVRWEEVFVSDIAFEEERPRCAPFPGSARARRLAPSFWELWPELKLRLAGRWLLAHGASTEKRLLRAFPFHGFGPWLDTLKIARALRPQWPSHALGDVAESLGLLPALKSALPSFRWHDALCDAAACALCFQRMVEEHGLAALPVSDLLRLDDSPYHKAKARSR